MPVHRASASRIAGSKVHRIPGWCVTCGACGRARVPLRDPADRPAVVAGARQQMRLAAGPDGRLDAGELVLRVHPHPGEGLVVGCTRACFAERRADALLVLCVEVLPEDRVVDDGLCGGLCGFVERMLEP